ncbi:MAG: response regulator [Planctomycetota bacterium]|nr:response regulator [Planctomycetota bacterium]
MAHDSLGGEGETPANPAPKMSPSATIKRPRVLVIEDHAPTRLAMSKLIRQAGAEVVTARDGEEGVNYLLTQRFDVLLTDLRMPVMDGFEVLQHCAKLPPSHRPARIIAISGEYEAGVLHGQPVQFLPKPFNLSALLDMIGGKPN